ncbi:MAG: putative Co/Zn/Cd efflux system rane fusion protein [Labilithrix sp.]|nr:putative Co/Zn/Cd efflux system rane fusion protein [Labilithrix sp.]
MTALGDPPNTATTTPRQAQHAQHTPHAPHGPHAQLAVLHGEHVKEHPPHGDLGFDLPSPAKVNATRVIAFAAIAAVLVAAAFLLAWLPKRHAQRELAEATKNNDTATLRVQVVAPKVKSSDRSMALPGSVQPLEETVVYPRSSGYVGKWHADMGDKVEAGAVLVEIDTPEIDQQLDQARAQLVQSQAALVQATANRDFSVTTLERYKKLTPQGVASQQELDQKQSQSLVDEANVKVAQAAIEAQKANVRRLVQMKSWGRVTAPFAGTVNGRMIERGALVSPTTPLYKISNVDPVRVFVQVPQDVAPSVRTDVPAQVTVREFAGRTFEGKVARAAGSLDPASRTMNTEIRVPNPKGELLGGMYAQVALTLPSPHRVFEVPATAVMNDAKGMRIAVVGPDSKLKLVPVVVERDTGPTIELATGITEGDRVVKLGSAELADGTRVEVVP